MCITQFISHIVIHSNLFMVTDLDLMIFVSQQLGSVSFFFFFFFFFLNEFLYWRSRICLGDQSKFDANWSLTNWSTDLPALVTLIYSYTPLHSHVTIKYQWKIIASINSIASRIIKSIIGIFIFIINIIK